MNQAAYASLAIESQLILTVKEDVDHQNVFNSNLKENALHATVHNTSNANAKREMIMPSEIIPKERGVQSAILQHIRKADRGELVWCQVLDYKKEQHKQSLINLKEDREEKLKFIEDLLGKLPCVTFSEDEKMWDTRNLFVLGEKNQIVEDLKELNKMIEAYE